MDVRDRLQRGIALLDLPLFRLGGTEVTLATVVIVALIMLATLWASRLLQKAVRRFLVSRHATDEGTIGVATRLLHYLVLFAGFGVALRTIGINLNALFAAGALFAVAIGFAMQNLTANFVSGVILLLERAIKPGDVVELDGTMMRVLEMGIRATIARTLDEEDLVIPNSLLVQSAVKNYTLRDRLYRVRAAVGVVYASDLRRVRQVLETVAAAAPWKSARFEPKVLLTEFGDSAVNFEVSVWTESPWQVRQWRSQLNEAIWWALRDAGIVIAFPQLDVHFDPPVVDSLQRLRAAV